MLSAATRQDVQGLVDGAKNTLLDRLAPKNFIQAIADSLRVSILQNLYQLHAENQMLMRGGQAQRDQLMYRMSNLEKNMEAIQRALNHMIEQQSRSAGTRRSS